MITYHHTSLLTSQAQTVVNTVNTVGVMGKGIAAAFKAKYPDMFKAYKKLCLEKRLNVGQLWLWKAQDQWVLNFPTKQHWRQPSKLEYIEAGLKKFRDQYEIRGIREISFPRLGCGNGGLNWSDVKPLMEDYLKGIPIPIYIHDFTRDIGLPEHNESTNQSDTEDSFYSFKEQIIYLIHEKDGIFNTLTSHKEFKTIHDKENNKIIIRHENKNLEFTEDDLYNIWTLLLRGPVEKEFLLGEVKQEFEYISSILSTLPFIRPIKVSSQKSEDDIALELILNDREPLPFANYTNDYKQGSLSWA